MSPDEYQPITVILSFLPVIGSGTLTLGSQYRVFPLLTAIGPRLGPQSKPPNQTEEKEYLVHNWGNEFSLIHKEVTCLSC